MHEKGAVMNSYKAKQRTATALIHIFLIIMSIIMIVPFVWMILTALKTNQEAISVSPFYFFPHNGWHWENFGTVWKSYNFLLLYKNTLLLIFFRVVCACLTATMAGYAFGRLNFPGKKLLFSLVLVQMMIPSQIFIIPQYTMVSKMGAINSMFGLVFPGLVTAFGTYLLKVGYEGLPKDLEEAATIDGANIGQRFLHIMMPLTRSSMVSLGIFTAVFAFKDLMWPMIVAPDAAHTTLSAALSKMQGQYSNDYPSMMAAAVLAILPMVIIYIIFQKQFVEGIATSGGKL
jgi:multiple sugar transport system permease protein